MMNGNVIKGSPHGSISLCVAEIICDLRVENRGNEYASGKILRRQRGADSDSEA